MSEHVSVPNVLIIPDGNRRWARENNVDYRAGYERTAEGMVAIANYLSDLGSQHVWFSVTRPFNNLRDLKELEEIYRACARLHEIGNKRGTPINVSIDGDATTVTRRYLKKLKQQEADARSDRITIHLLFNWSAEDEVVSLFRFGQTNPDAQSGIEDLRCKSVVGQRIDLIIRTGLLRRGHTGRLSGVVPWHSIGADLLFPPKLFPDYTTDDLAAGLAVYNNPEHKNQTALR